MESQPQNPESRINSENVDPETFVIIYILLSLIVQNTNHLHKKMKEGFLVRVLVMS